MNSNLEALELEIRSMYSRVRNGLNNRRVHPTFGYTKANLRAELNQLTGLLVAHRIVAGLETAPANPSALIHEYAEVHFAIDLRELSHRIDES